MKKLNLLIGILIGLTILSCSSNDDNSQLSTEDLLIQGSPWTFDHYEVTSILDIGNSSYTEIEIESDTNQALEGGIITFNNDGTGSDFFPNNNGPEFTWNWEIINNNQLKTVSANGLSNTINISVTSSQLITESEEGYTYDEQADYDILHSGKVFYQ
mgnify:CR=1 FL=1